MELQVGVKAVLRNSEGRILLLKRSSKKYPEIGPKWDIVGGRIEAGFPLIDNLKREIMEETRLVLTEEPALVAAQDILRINGRHVVRLTYVGRIEGDPVIDDEHEDAKWFDISEIRKLSEAQLDIYFKELVDKGIIG